MIIAIDGPAGSGKSSTARAVAQRLGFHHLDSGAFYRAITYAALRAGFPPERWRSLTAEELDAFGVLARADEQGFRLILHGGDVSTELRSAEVNRYVSQMSSIPTVRQWLLQRLRAAAQGVNLVADGRDIGTIVFPEAELKIFLTAEPRERARRRLAQEGKLRPTRSALAAEVERLAERDRMDTNRDVAPLVAADDALVLDTTRLSFDDQVSRIVALARTRMSG